MSIELNHFVPMPSISASATSKTPRKTDPLRLALGSLFALGIFCFAAKPAQAQTEACSYIQPGHATSNTYDVPFVDNPYLYLFNDVFAPESTGSQNVCDLENTSNAWNSTWNWPTNTGGVISYPCATIGYAVGDPPRNQNPNALNLPVLISADYPFPSSATFSMSGVNQYDVAYDLFFSTVADPGPSGTAAAEMMVWLNSAQITNGIQSGALLPHGVLLESNLAFTGIPGTYDLYCEMSGAAQPGETCANYTTYNTPKAWPEYVFLSKTEMTTFTGDLGKFIYHLSFYKGYFPKTDYVISLSFGIEVRYNTSPTGSLNVSQYSISVD